MKQAPEEGLAGWGTSASLSLAGCAGILIGLAGAPLEVTAPAFLAPGALLLAIEPSSGRAVTTRLALGCGLVMGVTTNAYSMYWVVGLLRDFGGFPIALALPVGALLWLGQSVPFVVAAVVTAALMRSGARGWLALPAVLTVAGSLTPALFPWRYGVSQLPFLPFVQVAELGGLPLLDWLVATVGCALVEFGRRPRRGPALLGLVALLTPVAFGMVRLEQVRAERQRAPRLAVGVVQPNIGIREKHDPLRFAAQLRLLHEMTRALEASGAEVVLWPESAYPIPMLRSAARDLPPPLGALGEGARGPVLAGTITTDGDVRRAVLTDEHSRFVGAFPLGMGRRFNSAVAIERGGRVAGIADKVRLLAFGEYVPLRDSIPFLRGLPPGLSAGEGAQQVRLRGVRIGVLNCYEDLLAEHVREQAAHAPELWANVTNNAWFGDTNAPHLHHMNARLRAIETRRDLVRAVNTGVSGHTLATGEDAVRTGSFVRASFVADARRLRGLTPWVALGDWVTPLAAGGLAGFAAARVRGRRSRQRSHT
jgi:apolipoprotein N-acyltransferase